MIRPMRCVGATVLILALAGCGVFGPAPIEPDPVPTEAAPVETPLPYPTAPDGVVATGAFESAAVETTGTVTVTKRDDRFVLALTDFTLDYDDQVRFVLTDRTIDGKECATETSFQVAASFSGDDGDTDMVVPVLTTSRYTDDPSFFTTASVVGYGTGESFNGCLDSFLGTATLDWTLPDLRPDLVLADSGSRDGAHGIITEDGDYLTTAGDVWGEIAKRFGITSDELEWLNPIRPHHKKGFAYDDEVLNLSKSHRGDSQRRVDYEYDGILGTVPTQ